MLNGMTAHDTSTATDEDLAARRDVGALYARYARRLLAFLGGLGVPRRLCEDVHHDVWLRVVAALAEKPFQGHFRGWLFQVARNLAIDRFRKAPEPAALPAEDLSPDQQPSPLESLLRQEE